MTMAEFVDAFNNAGPCEIALAQDLLRANGNAAAADFGRAFEALRVDPESSLSETEKRILDWLIADFTECHGRAPVPGDVLCVDEETGDEFTLADVIEAAQ